jgi:hypothetical protein
MKNRWGKLAGQLGIAYFLAGLFLVFLGWNGAATYDRVSAQVPYLISGGLAGLCLVVIGGSVLVAASAREGAAALEATVADLQEVVERMAAGAGSTGGQGSATGSGGAITTGVGGGSAGGQGSASGQGGAHTTGVGVAEGHDAASDSVVRTAGASGQGGGSAIGAGVVSTSGSGAGTGGARSQGAVNDLSRAASVGDDAVVTGPTSYHRPGCRLVEGQAGATTTTASEAAARGLTACRVCAPDVPARQDIPG